MICRGCRQPIVCPIAEADLWVTLLGSAWDEGFAICPLGGLHAPLTLDEVKQDLVAAVMR